MGMNPIASILLFQFDSGFRYAPQQGMSRFANRCKQEIVSADNRFEDILPQVDGVDYDPATALLKFRPLPMLQFESTRVGFQRYSHTWNYAIATEDLGRIQPAFRMQLPQLARMSWERFKDRILAGNGDEDRITTTDADFDTLTKTKLPAANRYAFSGAAGLTTMTVDGIVDIVTRMYSREVYDSTTGTRAMPTLTCSHGQVLALLKQEKAINSRYSGQLIPLVRGDINEFVGVEFIRLPSMKRVTATDGVYFKNADTEVKLAASAGFAQQAAEKILVSYPMEAFSCGIYPQAGYMHVWQNPTRSGAFEYLFKNTIAWKRRQNEYVLMAYGKDEQATLGAPLPKVTPVKGADYHANTGGGSVWDYDNVA